MTIQDKVMMNSKSLMAPAEKRSSSSGSSGSGLELDEGDENMERGNWTNRLDFLMSCVSYAVGLGNIWRFPYLCYRNGGAIFLIPYIFFLVLCGMPLFFMEVSFGQFASLSPISVWRISPLFKGVGYGMVIISGIVCIYYNIIIAWTAYYLFRSFSRVLPWSTCDNEWNTPACALSSRNASDAAAAAAAAVNASVGVNASADGGGGLQAAASLLGYADGGGGTNLSALAVAVNATMRKTSPSEEYWENHVLQLSSGIEDMGSIRWELFACLAFSWVVVFLCLIKGVKSSGKVVYFTATFPYLVLLCLLVRGVTLPGAMDGLRFYMVPRWHKLLSLTVWGEAAMQIFYSVGAAWGALITMASYNKFNNDCYRDARIVPILNCGTSIFAGFVIFSIIGFMAHETGSSIEDVVTKGPGLVFVVYPEAIARLPLSQVWAVLFFLMLFSIGLGSQFAMFQTMTSAFIDEFDWLKNRKVQVTAALCFLEFLLGIPCIMQGGIYVLQIMDWYSSTFSLMILSFTECVVIAWRYGVKQFYSDISLMIGYTPCVWWRILWCYVTPGLILFVLSFSLIIHEPVTYGSYTYPSWAIGIGWMFAFCSIIPLPAIAAYKFFTQRGPYLKRLERLTSPSADWGPALPRNREMYLRQRKGTPLDDGGVTATWLANGRGGRTKSAEQAC